MVLQESMFSDVFTVYQNRYRLIKQSERLAITLWFTQTGELNKSNLATLNFQNLSTNQFKIPTKMLLYRQVTTSDLYFLMKCSRGTFST